MANLVPDLIICGLILASLLVIHFFSDLMRVSLGGYYTHETLSQLINSQAKEYSWLLKLIINCFGYSCVFVPGYLIYKYVIHTNYLEKTSRTTVHLAVQMCITGSITNDIDNSQTKTSSGRSSPANGSAAIKRTSSQEAILLMYCFAGLMCSYLTWGVLQEKIMTQEYINFEGKTSHFKDSQFLVFANRLLAFSIAAICIKMRQEPRHRTPFYKYTYASFSNIMSAWFQYEALKFVNFPTQVLAKSCKIIPVMLMGKIMSRTKYECYEYLTAVLISLGMVFFMTGSAEDKRVSSVTTITGVFLLAMYMVFDSFTANWQGSLFKSYSMSPIQMMCGVNLSSTIFTAASLSMQGGFMDSLNFATEHPKFIFDCIILSISSTIGQLFIFYTISVFGPVVFTIIMTLRQAAAILLSCIIYNHSISVLGVFGVIIVFLAIFLRVYCNQRIKAIRSRAEASRPKLSV